MHTYSLAEKAFVVLHVLNRQAFAGSLEHAESVGGREQGTVRRSGLTCERLYRKNTHSVEHVRL